MLSIEQRLQSVREAEEEKPENGAAAGFLAFNVGSGPVMDVQEFGRVPARGGPTIFGLGEGFSVFLSAGAQALNHHNNRFEDGYAAQLPTVTVGADYRFGGRILVGLAFNYTNFSGDYDDGGDFDRNLFSPLLYTTVIPFQGAFADIVLGYTRQDNSYRRRAKAVITTALGDAELGTTFEGDASADYNGNGYTAGVRFGYDHEIGSVTVGPRIGVDFAHQQLDNFQESGNTGLELRYRSLNRTSVQSSLGARAAITVPFESGVLVPQVTALWVHEYADNARNIEAQYIEASPSPSFTFQREPPARNWATIDAGIVYQPYGSLFQAFANFSTMQGNTNFVSYGGTVGARFGF